MLFFSISCATIPDNVETSKDSAHVTVTDENSNHISKTSITPTSPVNVKTPILDIHTPLLESPDLEEKFNLNDRN